MSLRIYSDGGARGNPGPSAFAIVVVQNGKIIFERAEFLGERTNNYAEYRGLIAAITKAIELKESDVEFIMDSELVIKQMNGEYKVKADNIKSLHNDAKALSSMIKNTKFTHVRREDPNISRADTLLNIEMDLNSQ
ncbi:MAG: ribonuclease HI family protein [Candidatus Methanomethylophilaceae archaeon]|jgi:ribonuclease HI